MTTTLLDISRVIWAFVQDQLPYSVPVRCKIELHNGGKIEFPISHLRTLPPTVAQPAATQPEDG